MESVVERMERINAEEKIAQFKMMQKLPYKSKLTHAHNLIKAFVNECYQRELNYHVSVGGLDSIVLFLFLRKEGVDAVGISRSSLEDVSNRRVHQSLGILPIGPARDENGKPYSKPRIIQQFGFPVLSKEIASKIELLQNPSEDNKTVRHAIITGAQRTGCEMCGFGIQLEKRPHRFDRLHDANFKSWDYWMHRCCIGKNGEPFGWGKVLDYIGVSWDFTPDGKMLNIDGQISLF